MNKLEYKVALDPNGVAIALMVVMAHICYIIEKSVAQNRISFRTVEDMRDVLVGGQIADVTAAEYEKILYDDWGFELPQEVTNALVCSGEEVLEVPEETVADNTNAEVQPPIEPTGDEASLINEDGTVNTEPSPEPLASGVEENDNPETVEPAPAETTEAGEGENEAADSEAVDPDYSEEEVAETDEEGDGLPEAETETTAETVDEEEKPV